MSDKSPIDTLNGVIEVARAKEVELSRVIARVMEGDTDELVRAVVERVTEAMENVLCNWLAHPDLPDELALTDNIITDVCNAKHDAFKKATGRKFDTEANRMLRLRSEMRKVKPHAD